MATARHQGLWLRSTFGEMSPEEKHGLPPQGQGLSHRARAFMKLAEACLSNLERTRPLQF